METFYDNRKLIEKIPFPKLRRMTGVIVNNYVKCHKGLNGVPAAMVELEVPELNTNSSGGYYPVSDIPRKVREFNRNVLKQIDSVIEELEQHRDHIQQSLDNHDEDIIEFKESAKPASF